MPSLTSLSLVYLVTGLVTALLIGLIWAWPRLGGRGLRQIGLRLAALIAVQVSLLGLIFLVVNYQFGFYASWTDLFGKTTGGGTVVRFSHGPVDSTPFLTVEASTPVQLKGSKSADGTLDTIQIRGALSGMSADGYAYLPPGYPQPHRQYPVILVISAGGTGAYGASQLAEDAATAIRAGKLRPLILVMVQPPRYDQGCLNVPGLDQGATFFGQDIPDAVSASFRTAPSPLGWALLGDQSGGYCALQLTLTSAFTFSSAALPPASYQAPPGGYPIGTAAAFQSADNLAWVFRHYPMQPVSLLFTGGSAGPNLFRQAARPPTRTASMKLRSGPTAITPVIEWLRSRLSAGTGA